MKVDVHTRPNAYRGHVIYRSLKDGAVLAKSKERLPVIVRR